MERGMPVTLRSGLKLLLAGDAPFDPGKNWFKCPPDHFWIKVAAPEMGPPLFDTKSRFCRLWEHAPGTAQSQRSSQIRASM
jgi:hypothetical protein